MLWGFFDLRVTAHTKEEGQAKCVCCYFTAVSQLCCSYQLCQLFICALNLLDKDAFK